MLDRLSEASRLAIEARDTSVVESRVAGAPIGAETSGDTSVVDGWFARICKRLFSAKPGTALHYITGFDERSCQRYAAGKVAPPGYFIRALLRAEGGNVWLSEIMDGSDAAWWRDHQRALRIAAQVDKIDLG